MAESSEAKKARNLEEIRTVCRPVPLSGPALEAFFVETDRARDPHQSTRRRLAMALEGQAIARILFYGHRGCGKSTELNKFHTEQGARYLPVTFSVLNEMTPASVYAEDLILIITERVLAAAQGENLAVRGADLESVYDYFSTVTRESTESRQAKLDVDAGVDAAASPLAKLVGLFAKFRAEIKLDSHSEETAVYTLRKRPADLLQQANAVIEAVRDALPQDRELLVVVEDLDKLDVQQAREIYVNNVNLLTGVQANIIYTIPIFLFHSPDVNAFRHHFDDVISLPMIKVTEPPARRVDGFDVVKDIILSRVEETLIADDALALLVMKTGGVLRHAFEVLHTVACMVGIKHRIETEHIHYGLDQLAREFWQQITLPYEPIQDGPASVTVLYDRLAEYAAKQEHGERVSPVTDTTNQLLLKSCALVEYNGKGWFGVHPLVVDNLKALGRLS